MFKNTNRAKIDEVRSSFLDGLSRVCLTLGLGHFLCIPPLYYLFGGETAPNYGHYITTITLSGVLLTGIAFLSRFQKLRSVLSYFCLGLLFFQTCSFLFRESSLLSPVTMMFPMLSALATPILGKRYASYAAAALSLAVLLLFAYFRIPLASGAPYAELALFAIALFFTSYLSETLWHGMMARERELERALADLTIKNAEMEKWVERLGRAGSLISSGHVPTEVPHPPPSSVFVELTRSMEQMQEKVSAYFTKLFLQDRMNSLGVLASGIAHELNTPLTTMHFILKGDDQIPADTRERLIEEITRMGAIAKGLLSFARPADECSVDLNELVKNTLSLLTHSSQVPAQVTLDLTGEPVPIRAMPNEIQQVLFNLFHNSADAIESVPKASITARTSRRGTSAIVEIVDNGCGIESSSLSKILDPFFTTKPPGKGTGLGLFIVNQIVTRHGGHIEIESAPGEGTTVRLRFPLAEEAGSETKAA